MQLGFWNVLDCPFIFKIKKCLAKNGYFLEPRIIPTWEETLKGQQDGYDAETVLGSPVCDSTWTPPRTVKDTQEQGRQVSAGGSEAEIGQAEIWFFPT